MKKVLFVCTGNTCRSPMAEGLFKAFLKNKGIENIQVKSAGIAAFAGDEVSKNAVEAARLLGADISQHRAKGLTKYDVDEAGLIVCMTESHCNFLKEIASESKLFLPKIQISDPFGGNLDEYLKSAKTINAAFYDILNALDGFLISKVTKEHIDDIYLIESQSFSVPWSKNAFLAELEKDNLMFFAAFVSGELVAYIAAVNILGEVHINNIAVKKEYRRRLIANALINHIIDISEKAKASLITLEVRKSNTAAIKLYENLGFEIIGERQNYYTMPKENAYIMTKFLNKKGRSSENISD